VTRRLLCNAALIDPETAPDPPRSGCLLLEDGRIRARLPANRAHEPGGAEVVDLGGGLLAPGFLDVHLHGSLIFAADDALDDALAALSASCVRHGTTGFLITTVAWQADRLARFVTQARTCMTRLPAGGAAPLGLHLEGPWISPLAAGAQPRPGIRPYRAAEGDEILALGEGAIRMVTLAPEVEGAARLLEDLARRGVVAALGHSLAASSDLDAALDAGLTHVTHLFNAMGPMHHRGPGVAARALAEDRLSCDLICDGAHVDPEWVRVAARAKRERLLLISDRVELPARAGVSAAAGGPDFGAGRVRDDGTALRLPDGTLAGSSLTLDRALRNARAFGAWGLPEAVAACTLRPARLLGLEAQRGTLRPGARVDLVVLDADGRVLETWIGGERVYTSPRATP
jgi:N-acetylglucosamine-6-phosphate deacetylase